VYWILSSKCAYRKSANSYICKAGKGAKSVKIV